MTEVTLVGDKELLAKLNKLADGRYKRKAYLAMGLHLKGKMKRYPRQKFAANPNRVYKRTRNLAKRWVATAKQDHVKVWNFAHYAPYVQGNKQRHFHRQAGWVTAKDIMELQGHHIEYFFENEISQLL